MKTLILAGLLMLVPAGFSSAAIYMEYEDVEGESGLRGEAEITLKAQPAPARATTETETNTRTNTTTRAPSNDAQTKGTGEGTRKAERDGAATSSSGNPSDIARSGEKGILPDEIDFNGNAENATNFGILLDTGSGDDGDDEERARGLERAQEVLLENAKASEQAIERITINAGKITTHVTQKVKLFGVIPVDAEAQVEIDAEEHITVKFPWWAFLASDKNPDDLGERIFTTLSNILKTKHDTVKNAINNVR